MIIEGSYVPGLVIASVMIAIWASYVALQTARRVRAHSRRSSRALWVALTALCLGGGIWSMHFVAMLAFEIPLAVGFDPGLTVLSLALPIVTAAVGFAYLARDPDPTWAQIVLIGVIFGVAIVAMHYTGMHAMRMAASMEFDFRLVALSFMIAVVASIAALRMSQHDRGPYKLALGSVLMGLAISGMHYTGMAALTLHEGAAHAAASAIAIDRTTLGIAVVLVFSVIIATAWGAATVDRNS